MKTELCWNRTKTAEGQVAGAWLAGKLTVQTPRRLTADTQVQHTNKAHALPALLIGTFEEEHAPPGAAHSVASHQLLSWLVRWDKLREA